MSASRTRRLEDRDAAIRDARSLYGDAPPTAVAKALARDLARYLATAWRHQRDVEELPPDVERLRAHIHRIARLNDGEALRWRQIANVLSGARRA